MAYSGGLDSHVLLHALSGLRRALAPAAIEAVHINHGLSANAGAWEQHCRDVCEALGVAFRSIAVDAGAGRGESPEAAARRARYAALAGLMSPGDCLLTAHHQGDQCETVLLHLLRGSGPHGLSAMPCCSPFAAGYHARPLLEFTRPGLQAYAAAHGLEWIEDESNTDTALDRNYLRHQVLPHLRRRWPALDRTVSRAARHSGEAAQLLDEMAREDLPRVAAPDLKSLAVDKLAALSTPRVHNVIRFWLRSLALPLPGSEHMGEIEKQVFTAASDRVPCVRWPGVELHRYRDRLYAFAPLSTPGNREELHWNIEQPLRLPAGDGLLIARACVGEGIRADLCYSDQVTVRFRRGGERCRPVGVQSRRTLKNLFQERAVPPWMRDRIPLVFVGGQLAAVVDHWVCQPYQAQPDEHGIIFQWQRSRQHEA